MGDEFRSLMLTTIYLEPSAMSVVKQNTKHEKPEQENHISKSHWASESIGFNASNNCPWRTNG